MFGLESDLTILLLLCLLCACIFEFINGFHDTANAVATVIYTNSLKPVTAVIWSGVWNFLGVLLGGTAVAMSIIKLLPSGIFIEQSINGNVVMILSMLLSAIIWNLGTWYFAIPCSSSHTLIGSVLGVGITYAIMQGTNLSTGVNWSKAGEIGLFLLISPLIGFIFTMLMMKLLQKLLSKKEDIFNEPKKDKSPPWWIRMILILTCTGVSYSHGSNDGQKGVGLVMLILIAIVPAKFALDLDRNPVDIRAEVRKISTFIDKADLTNSTEEQKSKISDAKVNVLEIGTLLASVEKLNELPDNNRQSLRKKILSLDENVDKSVVTGKMISSFDLSALKKALGEVKSTINYAPSWVFFMISISLGLGTMIGWKRIVRTIGEKIGKEHLSYAQGASAELVAAGTIGISSSLGLPVSTTQVLSSGIAGSMVATKGMSNLQGQTIKNILIAWLLTLPVTMVLAGGLYYLLFHFFA